MCKVSGCSRPNYVENGRVHEFCGRTHFLQYTASSTQPAQQGQPLCGLTYCNRPAYFDGRSFSPACGITHLSICKKDNINRPRN